VHVHVREEVCGRVLSAASNEVLCELLRIFPQ
jgi:hypothetical protein